MSNTTKYGIVALVVIAALFGLYAAFAKTTTTNSTTQPGKTTGGVGDFILSLWYA